MAFTPVITDKVLVTTPDAVESQFSTPSLQVMDGPVEKVETALGAKIGCDNGDLPNGDPSIAAETSYMSRRLSVSNQAEVKFKYVVRLRSL